MPPLTKAILSQMANSRASALQGITPQKSVLGWNTLRQLFHDGLTLGAHTQTHPMLNRLNPDEAYIEITGSHRDLEREVGTALAIFAYPIGGVNTTIAEILRTKGFQLAFTTHSGVNRIDHADPLQLHRTNIRLGTTIPILRIKCLR